MTLIVMAWGEGGTALVDRFVAARSLWGRGAAATYQGFIKAMLRGGLGPLRWAAGSLRRRVAELAGSRARRWGFFVLAADGSRFELPRTAGHERVFGTAGRGGSGPQVWVTMLWQMGLGLPWAWRIGRADSSERDHLLGLLDQTPADSLLVMDAGFSGYRLLSAIADSGRHFLVRASGGVRLLSDLGYAETVDEQTVWLWPERAQRHRRPPLTLRLIRLPAGVERRGEVCLLTNVRDPARLSDEQASTLYRMRWGVELGYRSLKQTLERRKLRSHGPAQALFELHGLILGLMLLGLMTVAAILHRGGDPLSWSVAAALRVVRRALRQRRSENWFDALGAATKDPYRRRRKTRRPWPRKKHAEPPPGPPRLRPATPAEAALAQQLTLQPK